MELTYEFKYNLISIKDSRVVHRTLDYSNRHRHTYMNICLFRGCKKINEIPV